ncbi:hydrogenase [Caballeronia udeis]|uniref:Hydrogenase n=1 Tax=Caballeronia udeis TaxID=1232866 RepID=A0A158FEM1_9BURK|nr:nitrogen fixation protein NifQ [Caballeronia udeis]SAL17500.1 hydrogenase [Caballeronia udeis]
MTHLLATRAELLAASATPHSPGTALFATLLAAHDEPSLLGLSREQIAVLYGRHFGAMRPPGVSLLIRSEEQAGFVSALETFLLRQAQANDAAGMVDADCLASIIAHACLRPDHLWRDLGLTGRDDVTNMLNRYFPNSWRASLRCRWGRSHSPRRGARAARISAIASVVHPAVNSALNQEAAPERRGFPTHW